MKTASPTIPLKIGLIATGDELTQGDILNTNGQTMALALHELGFHLHYHLIVDDQEPHIVNALEFLLAHCDIVILSGGLGPTSDDRTRFALATALEQELVFDMPTWERLQTRLQALNRPVGDHNRQQAFFPKNATILPNPNGTAPGCMTVANKTKIFMLPGPPGECLPMFFTSVIPEIKSSAQATFNFKWLLLGANEGEIAAKLDHALAELSCRTGYRWNYPYLEFKIFAADAATLAQAEILCLPIVSPYLISKDNQTARDLLRSYLLTTHSELYFESGWLNDLVKLSLLNTHIHIHLLAKPSAKSLNIKVEGLAEYWTHDKTPCISCITLSLQQGKRTLHKELSVYYRNEEVKEYIVEVIAKEILIFYGVL